MSNRKDKNKKNNKKNNSNSYYLLASILGLMLVAALVYGYFYM